MADLNIEARFRAANARIHARDAELAEELAEVRGGAGRERAEKIAPVLARLAEEGRVAPPSTAALETIVQRTGRPVLAVVNDEAQLDFHDAESEIWRKRLVVARARLGPAIRAAGRIELEHHYSLSWVGTGWLVDDDLLVTNRHVAVEFARRGGEGFVFRQGLGGKTMNASIDFLEEMGRAVSLDFKIAEVVHIQEDGPDVAFLRVEPVQGRELARKIPLATAVAPEGQFVATIGYPARDSRIPEQDLMHRIFGEVYDKKRLAPGVITGFQDDMLLHDCSTLGGNSGSVLVDLQTGNAVALHFAGRFLEANFAVPAPTIAGLLRNLGRGGPVRRGLGGPVEKPRQSTSARPIPLPSPQAPRAGTAGAASTGASVGRSIDCVVPIRIRVDVGAVEVTAGTPSGPPAPLPPVTPYGQDGDEEVLLETEATPADYANRQGYVADFLRAEVEVPLPKVLDDDDVLAFLVDGKKERVLRYEHFSVVMSKRRRLCRYSAANIDGGQSRKVRRAQWRTDPRLKPDQQVTGGVYGNFPKFARGHMTRREDPVWGDADTASRANADTFHITNAVPQLQPFNAPIWLGLEDYALEHAREDRMQISVFTGPFLQDDDPVRYGVQVPRSFWKVIAFIHDETGKLCATGYSMSQEKMMSEAEFVFGPHETAQLPLRQIEEQAGLSFGPLRARDPLEHVEAVEGGGGRILTDFDEIQFVAR